MNKAWVVAAMLLAGAPCVAAGARKPKVREIDGKEVMSGPSFPASPVVDIRNLRFYTCTLKKNKAPCLVVTGTVIPHVPNQNYVVTLDINMYELYGPTVNLQNRGTTRVVVEKPVPDQPTRFVGLGEPPRSATAHGPDGKCVSVHYAIHVYAKPYKPPKLPPVK